MTDSWLTRIQAANMLRPQALSDEQANTIGEQRRRQFASIPEALSMLDAPSGPVTTWPPGDSNNPGAGIDSPRSRAAFEWR